MPTVAAGARQEGPVSLFYAHVQPISNKAPSIGRMGANLASTPECVTLGSDFSRSVSSSATLYSIQQILDECLLRANYYIGTLQQKLSGFPRHRGSSKTETRRRVAFRHHEGSEQKPSCSGGDGEMALERISRKSVTGARLKGSLVLSGQRRGIFF